jgi:hypothetical protein
MKLNDIKQIEENLLKNIGGAIKDRFKQGGYQTTVQNIFIKDFVQDAITSLNNGVKGGLIDPNIKSSGQAPAGTVTAPPTTPSSAAVPTTSPTQVPPAQQTGQTMSPQQTATAQMQTRAGIQPTGQKMTAAQRTQAQLQARKMQAAQKPVPVNESSYDKMNRIFESIINIDEAEQLRTISDYMMDWFGQYMQGVEWTGSKAIVKQKMDKLQDEYPKNIDANLNDLARMGLALSKAGSPAGAPPEFTKANQEIASSVEDLKGTLEELSKSNPRAYNDLIKNLKPVQVGSL